VAVVAADWVVVIVVAAAAAVNVVLREIGYAKSIA